MDLILNRWHAAAVAGLILIWLAASFTNYQIANQPDPAEVWAIRLGMAYGLAWVIVVVLRWRGRVNGGSLRTAGRR